MQLIDSKIYPNLAKLQSMCADFLRLPATQKLSPDEREIQLCRLNPLYWMQRYGFIRQAALEDKEVKIVPFRLSSRQLHVADRACLGLTENPWKSTKLIVLKPRKAWMSTLFAAFDYWFLRFVGGCGAFLIADKAKHTTNIFEMLEIFHKHDKCPGKPERIPMSSRSKEGLRLSNGSMLECDSGETKHPGTSQTLQVIHMSENAKWPQLDTAELSLLNSQARDGFVWIIRESTGCGLNKFEQDCALAEDHRSDWGFVFVPWFELEDCTTPLEPDEDFQFQGDEAEIAALYSLSREQVKFRRNKIKDIGLSGFQQDFPSHSREPFLVSAKSYFWIEKLQDRVEEIDFYDSFHARGLAASLATGKFPTIKLRLDEHRDPKDIAAFTRKLFDKCITPRKVQIFDLQGKVTWKVNEDLKQEEGLVWMWRDPDRRRKYVVVVDSAEGVSSGQDISDLSVVEVIDCFKREQVAEFAGLYDEEVTARFAVLLAKLYANAMIIVEMNNKCGGVVLEKIHSHEKYHYLYRTQTLSKGQVIRSELGWRTTRGNKNEICAQLKLDFKNSVCQLHSRPLLLEMLHFVEEKGKLRAAAGHTDDRITAMSIGLTVIEKTPGLHTMTAEDAEEQIERGFLDGGKELPNEREYLIDRTDSVVAPGQIRHQGRRLNRYGIGVGR